MKAGYFTLRLESKLLAALLVLAPAVFGSEFFTGWIYFPLETTHSSMIVEEARRAGVDPSLLMALVAQESRFEESAVSRSGAIGLAQLMYTTAFGTSSARGVCMDLPKALSDPRQNVRCGARYLSQLLVEFRGDEVMALQAYHDGPTGARWLRWYGGMRVAKKESREYVGKVLARRPAYSVLY